jgi:2-dehydropantoate 2-reductase
MEVEPLVGVVQELGRRLDVPTPTIDVVLALIRQRARCASQYESAETAVANG